MVEPTAWHREVIPAGWSEAAQRLADRSVLEGFYLAGGTGLALHVGHRRSVDLDLFREAEFSSTDLRDRLRTTEGFARLETAPGTVHLQLGGVKVSFFHCPYPLLFPARRFDMLAVADPRDIACMKVDAIANRGSRRDFVDLYIAARIYGLARILEWFVEKYASVSYSRTHLLKALTYFEDAERDPPPDLLAPLSWSDVRTFFRTEAPSLLRVQ